MRLVVPLVLLATLAACGESKPPAPAEPACDLSLDSLVGRSFVMLEVMGDRSEVPNPMARLRIEKDGAAWKAKYTVKSMERVYDYACTKVSDKELQCLAEPNLAAMCLALEVNEAGACSKEALEKMGIPVDAAKWAEAEKQAKEALSKVARDSDAWPRFKATYNSVGQPLMGQLYVKIDPKRCRLSIDDMYVTIYDGKKTEDFNPVGTNAFVESKDAWLWDDCESPRVLAGWKDENLPTDLSQIEPIGTFPKSSPVHFFYVGNRATKAEEGCTYSVDTYASWRPIDKGVAIQPDDAGNLSWHTTHTFSDASIPIMPGKKGSVFHMTRYKTCGGKQERIDGVCAAAVLE